MATNCSIELKKDKLPKLINKLDFFIFRAIENKGIDLATVAKEGVGPIIREMLRDVKNTVIPYYIAEYEQASKDFETEGNKEAAELYKIAATNLTNMLAIWPKLVANYVAYNNTFKIRNKFTLDEDGLVNMDEVADDEEKMLKKMVFDKPSNEIDPIEEVDKSIELFIKSIPMEDIFDEYGYTTSVDYSSFVRNMFTDLENSVGLEEIIEKLEKKKEKVPEYQYIIDKLTYAPGLTKQEMQFRIKFRNSFAKAFVPIYTVSLEDNGVIKVFEAAVGKKRLYESIISSNFALRGMEVNDGEKKINLAHEEDGVWTLDKTDIPKILDFLDKTKVTAAEFKRRRVEFFKAIGFEFSPETEQYLINSNYLDEKNRFSYIANHLFKSLQNDVVITDPLSSIKTKVKNLKKEESKDARWGGQGSNIADIIALEMKNNTKYNVERSIITAEGTRMHAIQLHNNFTKVIKYLSDSEFYPTLQDILDSEPSMFWLDPVKNPAIRNSTVLNSLFYFDPAGENYGQRRRVTSTGEFSATEGVPVQMHVVNTGGVKLNVISESLKEGSSSTSLNELDKLLQDINLFKSKNKITSVLRLGDKSTDLGVYVDYYQDPITGKPVKTPLGKDSYSGQVFSTDRFLSPVRKALQDIVEMKYLRSKGFLEDMKNSSDALSNTWGYFDSILTADTKKALDELIKNLPDIDNTEAYLDGYIDKINKDVTDYFEKYSKQFVNKFDVLRYKLGIEAFKLINAADFESTVKNYLANTFIMDMEQMKVLFGDSFYFKDFHKRASKDSATGIFADVDSAILEHLNEDDTQGYGANTNLEGKRLIERVYQQKLAELEKTNKTEKEKSELADKYKSERDAALQKQQVTKSYKSAVLKDVDFISLEIKKIQDAYETLKKSKEGFVSEKMQKLFEEKLQKVITSKYKGTEADGQGKCTFDFYRTMSILTGQWSDEQETVYNKIVEYSHYDELADAEEDSNKKTEYIQKRDAVGYDPTEAVYFPPKKFQYAGPQMYSKLVEGAEYVTAPPVFDKFSLQPLIPTNIKGTVDEQLAKKMLYNGVGYVKFISASKTEAPKKMDSLYVNFDENDPANRTVKMFSPEDSFSSEQELFFDRLKEQVTIDAEIHENSIFGSQIRKLILMNLDRNDLKTLGKDYVKLLDDLIELEKTDLYDKMGITKEDGKLKVKSLAKVVDYFFKEISKKNQDSNVRKALKYDEATGKFELPLDGAVQAQVLEGIVISAINNRVVRYKTNGSMLVQTAITGSDRIKFDKAASKKALETYGNQDLNSYSVVEKNGKLSVTKMEVKIALTGQWLNLLNLDHPDKTKIGTIERLNEALLDEAWVERHEKKLTMVSYRIPTQGRNFMDVMRVKQFLPASAGDVIVMPSEIVIKSGSDFDIDKMFTFYPNLTSSGNYVSADYTEADLKNPEKYNQLKGAIQNRVYERMAEIILHPSNFIELVTPSENYEILPIINEIYEKLNPESVGKGRQKTDYKNTDILSREKNIRKFISLLKGKNDLGIAAIANTFNVLFQLSKAKGNPKFFADNGIKTYFTNENIVKYANGLINNVNYATIYDENGALKSEFFSEFINAFVDVARDDYVFAVNVVTELSPIAFYMKYTGMSSEKILNFINQPAIRSFTKKMMDYQNKFVKAAGYTQSARTKARNEVLLELGYYNKDGYFSKAAIGEYIENEKARLGITNLDIYFTEESLAKGIRPDGDLTQLSDKAKLIQVAMIYEMENLKAQTNSMTEIQRALNFDSNPYASAFDAYSRNEIYKKGIQGGTVLNPETVKTIKSDSIISHLDVYKDITQILSELFPVRNNEDFNEFIHKKVEFQRNNYQNKAIVSQDDMLKFARTAKNDYISYILQNFIGRSKEGMDFFSSTFETSKDFNEYMQELVTTTKLRDMLNTIKSLPDYEDLTKRYPFIKNIIIQPGQNNRRITTFKIVENSSNPIEKESVIQQFEELVNLEDPEYKMVRTFFRNLALYSMFQSGLNTSDNSFTNLAPIDLVNKLYGSAVNEYDKLSDADKKEQHSKFYQMFVANNPVFFGYKNVTAATGEMNSKGKWYSTETPLKFEAKKAPAPAQVATSLNTKATVIIHDGTIATKDAARRKEGVYAMRPNPGDNIPGVDENYHFGNPWSHAGYQGTIKTGSLSEAEAKALGTWKGDVTSTAISEAAENYEKWLKGEAFQDVEPERRKWILSIVNAGRLDNKNLLYFKSGYRSHADVLADFINNRSKEAIGKQVKLGVQELFKSNSELASIGTPEQYSIYLDSIFPNSQVKDVVYHGTNKTFDKFKGDSIYFTDTISKALGYGEDRKTRASSYNISKFRNKYKFNIASTSKGFVAFGDDARYKLKDKTFDNINDAVKYIEDFINSTDLKDEYNSIKTQGTSNIIFALLNIKSPLFKDDIYYESKPENNDSIIGKDIGKGGDLGKTYAVFEPEQIHILGNKQDVEGFKKFVSKSTPTTGKSVKIISDDDIAAYNAYLAKSGGKQAKEFFTSATTFKEFYNPATGKREKAPQSSKWLLQDNGLYDLVDKDGGEIYITNVDLKTGMKMVETKQVVTAPASKAIIKPAPGVENIPNSGLSIEQSNQFIDLLQPQILNQAYVENKAKTANMMFSFGLRWAKNIPNESEKSEQAKNLGKPRPNRKAIKSKEGMTYGYYTTDQNNNPLPPIEDLQPIMDFIESKLGIDMSNYDAMLGNIYDESSFIHQHRDTTESVTAEGYPVIVLNLGADGHLEYDKDFKSTYASYKKSGQLDLTNGGIYAFGINGENRFTFHHRIGSGLESPNPLKPITLPNGQTLTNYRITLTFRRASDLLPGMPEKPAILKPTTVSDKFSKKNIFTVTPIQAADKKAKVKASIATQFIGFGEEISGSSTELYRKQAGKFANTGKYSNTDVIFVSVPGKRGDAAIAKREQDKTIKEAIKALEAGATILVDNKAYTEASSYNTGEKRLLKNLEAMGYNYSETTVDGELIGVWSKASEVKEEGLTGQISKWIEKELPSSKIETPLDEIAKMYESEKLSGETIEEFLERIACNGKLK